MQFSINLLSTAKEGQLSYSLEANQPQPKKVQFGSVTHRELGLLIVSIQRVPHSFKHKKRK